MKSKTPAMDASQTAARVVGETIRRHEQPLPADLEAAWVKWSAGIANMDPRMEALLRAAFEAGAEAIRKTIR
jgi:hypothetical protein